VGTYLILKTMWYSLSNGQFLLVSGGLAVDTDDLSTGIIRGICAIVLGLAHLFPLRRKK
jgi:hypothetical protein